MQDTDSMINGWFLIQNYGGEKAVEWHIQSAERRNVKHAISHETILQKWRETKDIHRQRLRESGASRPDLQEVLKEVLQAERGHVQW